MAADVRLEVMGGGAVSWAAATPDIEGQLESRLGPRYAHQRLRLEEDHEAQIFGQGLNFFHIENWYSSRFLIRNALRLTGLYRRGLENAKRVVLRRNEILLPRLPAAFDGFRILHVSDLHVDMNEDAMQALARLLASGLEYDLCVLTGDYRGRTWGPFEQTLAGLARLRPHLHHPVFGVLGNHDTIRMLPGLEELGIRMLVNESEVLKRGAARLHLAGIDDAHYFRADNIEKAAAAIPDGEFSILLSHTPEIYRQAASADFDLLLAGHTHGGQICLPGSIAITLDSALPRRLGSGAWSYRSMEGYTSAGIGSSILAVRFNCPPSVTLHSLRRSIGAVAQAPSEQQAGKRDFADHEPAGRSRDVERSER